MGVFGSPRPVEERIRVRLRLGAAPCTSSRRESPRRLPFTLHSDLDCLLLVSHSLLVSHPLQRLDLNLLERQECHHRRPKHLEDLVDVLHLLANRAVSRAEGADAHLLGERLPRLHHAMHAHQVFRVGPVEAERVEVA